MSDPKPIEMSEDSLRTYLTFLDKTPLLTRKQESNLFSKMQKAYGELFRECVKFSFFREGLNTRLVKTTKTLITKSPLIFRKDGDTVEYDKILSRVMLGLLSDHINDWDEVISFVKPTGTLARGVLDSLNSELGEMRKVKYLHESLGFFKTTYTDMSRLFPLVRRCLIDPIARDMLQIRLQVSAPVLKARLLRVDDLSHAYPGFKRGYSEVALKQLEDVGHVIETTEREIAKVREIIINANLRLVVSRARRITSTGISFQDLIQQGNIGLIKAVSKFDSSRGSKLSTYATWWIDQALQRAVANKAKVIRVPTHVQVLLARIKKVTGPYPIDRYTPEELVEKLDVKLSAVKVALHTNNQSVTLESQLSIEGKFVGTQKLIALEDTPFQIVSDKLDRVRVREALSQLSKESEMVIRLKFGIGEFIGRQFTNRDISMSHGISKRKIQRIVRGSLKLLKKRGGLV